MMQVRCSVTGRFSVQPVKVPRGSYGRRQALPDTSTKRRYLLASIASSCGLLLTKEVRAAQVFTPEVDPETSPLIQDVHTAMESQKSCELAELLKRTEENKEARKQERLDGYNRRNFKDYFGLEQDSPGLSPATREKIKEWLGNNKEG